MIFIWLSNGFGIFESVLVVVINIIFDRLYGFLM